MLLPKPNVFKSTFYAVVPIGGVTKYVTYNSFQFFGHLLFRHHEPEKEDRKQFRQLADQFISQLQPFDIIVTKSDEYLTNQVIPGNFTHAAIWLGPNVLNRWGGVPRHEKRPDKKITIRDKYLAEAITSGVHMGNLKETVINPVTLIIRFKSLSVEQQQIIIRNIANQKGKKYDFYFDFESSDRINCTEMVFLAFDFIHWKMDLVMDNWVIYPDNIVKTALTNNAFDIPILLFKGEIVENPSRDMVIKLLTE